MTIKSIIEDLRWHAFYCDRTINGCQARNILREAADALEKLDRHGRWVWDAENECWLCSTCEQSALNNYRGNSADSNYCPNCGARMDGDADAEE